MNNKAFFIVAVILIAVSIIGFKSYVSPRTDAALKIKVADFPAQIGGWSATEIPLSERDYEILETRNLFMRDYKNQNGQSVYFYLIYSEDNRKVSHPPEVCFMGSGASILDKGQIQISDSIKANRLIVEKGNFRQAVVYWYKAGNLYTDKYLRQQFRVVMDRMLGKRTSGALIRISTDIKNNNLDEAIGLLKSFGSEIEPLLKVYAP